MKAVLGITLLLAGLASAQFQFFEQFFQGGQQQQASQEKQNAPSDSNWYRQNWAAGKLFFSLARAWFEAIFAGLFTILCILRDLAIHFEYLHRAVADSTAT